MVSVRYQKPKEELPHPLVRITAARCPRRRLDPVNSSDRAFRPTELATQQTGCAQIFTLGPGSPTPTSLPQSQRATLLSSDRLSNRYGRRESNQLQPSVAQVPSNRLFVGSALAEISCRLLFYQGADTKHFGTLTNNSLFSSDLHPIKYGTDKFVHMGPYRISSLARR